MWLHSLKVAQLLRSAACLHTNQSRSYLNHLVTRRHNSEGTFRSHRWRNVKSEIYDCIYQVTQDYHVSCQHISALSGLTAPKVYGLAETRQAEPTFQARKNVWQIRILNSERRNIILGTSKCSYIRYFKRAGKEDLKKINYFTVP